jgi:hypothetical protein
MEQELRNFDLVDVGSTRATVVAVKVESRPSASVHKSTRDCWIAIARHDKEPFAWLTGGVPQKTRTNISANDVLRLEEVHGAIVCHCWRILSPAARIAQLVAEARPMS